MSDVNRQSFIEAASNSPVAISHNSEPESRTKVYTLQAMVCFVGLSVLLIVPILLSLLSGMTERRLGFSLWDKLRLPQG
jgi:hypothetical protein